MTHRSSRVVLGSVVRSACFSVRTHVHPSHTPEEGRRRQVRSPTKRSLAERGQIKSVVVVVSGGMLSLVEGRESQL